MTALDVGLCQYALGTADTLDDLTAAVADLLDRAGPADLYILPELFLCDLRLEGEGTPATETALSEDERATCHGFVQREAEVRDAVVVGGSYHVVEDGQVFNRMPVATPEGFHRYDKCHPTPHEREGGTVGGTADPPLVEHAGTTVGVLNCYDVEFPSLPRRMVDAGAEVLAVPSWTATDAGAQRVARCSAARAVENQCYVASVPLVGNRGDAEATGRAGIYAPCDDVLGPHGTRLTLPRDEHTAAAGSVDVAALRESRESAAVRPYTDYLEGN